MSNFIIDIEDKATCLITTDFDDVFERSVFTSRLDKKMDNTHNSTIMSEDFIKMCPIGDSSAFFVVVKFPSKKYIISFIFFCVTICVLIIPTVLLNGISVLTISRNFHLQAKPCYFVVFIQSITDLFVGIISLPLYIFIAAKELLNTAKCVDIIFADSVAFIPMAVSFSNLFLLTLERYMSILHSVAHRSRVTKKMMITNLGCVTFMVIFMGPILKVISEKVFSMTSVAIVTILLAFNTFAYIKIFFAVKSMQFPNDAIGVWSAEENVSAFGKKQRRSLREKKLAKSCALVVAISYLSYIPFSFCFIYFSDNLMKFRVAMSWCTVVASLNSSLNSVVFFWKRPLLRAEALKFLRNVVYSSESVDFN